MSAQWTSGGEAGSSRNAATNQHTGDPIRPRKNSKAHRILEALEAGSLNRFEAARIGDSALNSTISRLRNLVFLGLGFWFYEWASDGWHLFELPDSGWGIWLFALVAYDFSYYWFHRISHEVNLFWAAHVVHHSSEDYNLGTALRQSGSGLFGFIFYLPWLVVGIPADIFFAAGAINLVYQFWVHTEHVRRIGPLEWVLITPSNHRVHHAQNEIYIDRNYGGILCIWDRIFGSFQDELPEEPCIFGIRKPLHSHNPIWANFHVYWSTLQDSWRTRRWSDKLRVWLKGPGWRPEDVARDFPVERADLAQFSKYEPEVPAPIRHYAFFQFFCTTLASVWLMVFAGSLTGPELYTVVALALLSFYVQSLFTDGIAIARRAEQARLVISSVALMMLNPGMPWVGLVTAYLLISLTWLWRTSLWPVRSPVNQ